MIEWTDTARKTLDDYCARSRAGLAGTGADADEVVDDLRRHVEEEARASRLTVVTEEDVRRILTRIGEPATPAAQVGNTERSQASASPAPKTERVRPGYLLLILGVLLPLVTLVFELVTAISAGVLFDPLPSWFHVVAIALVPAGNFWMWWAARRRNPRHAGLLGWLNSAVLGVCLYYVVLYLPFTPIAVVGVIYFGLGLVPLAPLLALLATPFLRTAFRQQTSAVRLPGAWQGALVSLGLLFLLQFPTAVTYYGLAKATSEDPEIRLHGIRVLRAFGDEELMLRASYGLLRREIDLDLVRSLASGDRTVSAEQAREVYYRATGRPFNSVPPPSLYTRAGRWAALDEEFSWDDALGGEVVAGRVKGLSLLSSRMDTVAEPDACVAYCEWTLEFKNSSRQPREARAQIALPPEAVVSRVNLWVDGEEREAAFAGRSQTRQAYRDVAVVERRDPILVTTCGPDRILMQCFPVPPDGGVMKVRIGITSPLMLESPDRGRFCWPRILERNFGVSTDLKHALWIESPEAIGETQEHRSLAPSAARGFSWHEDLTEVELSSSPQSIVVHRSPAIESVWTPATDAGQFICQSIRKAPLAAPSRLVIVVDGSAGMQPLLPELNEALSKVPESMEIALVLASDQVEQLESKPQKATPGTLAEVRQGLSRLKCAGGQDNVPALVAAWDLAAATDRGVVLWFHLPQAVLLSPENGLRQRIERSSTPTRLVELQVRNGPDRVIEKLDGLAAIEHVWQSGSIRSDVQRLTDRWTGKSPDLGMIRQKVSASSQVMAGHRVSRQIERLWARDEAFRLAAARNREAAGELAAAHQLVTPLTGAVVLETQQQYDRHGLKPAEPATVPAIPEPEPWALVGVGILAFALLRSQRRPDHVFWAPSARGAGLDGADRSRR